MSDRLQLVPRYVGIAAGARLFALIAIGVPSILLREEGALVAVLLLGVVWTGAITLSVVRRVPAMLALVTEGVLVALVVALSLGYADTLHLTALAVTPFIAGLRRGPRGVGLVIAAQLAVLLAVAFSGDDGIDAVRATELFSAAVLGFGVGLVSSFLRALQTLPEDQLTPYRDARALVRQLLSLSNDLDGGLDPVSIAERIAERAGEVLDAHAVIVYVERDGLFVPLLSSPATGGVGDRGELVRTAATTGDPAIDDDQVALPLATDAGIVGVVAGQLTDVPTDEELAGVLGRLEVELAPQALRLDTALLFNAVREAATSEERQRLAREVHDGVAQGVASLGYLVDALAADATDPVQAEGLAMLRRSITDVVAEIRRSVFNLRNEAAEGLTLGERVRAVAENLERSSGMQFDVDVEESDERLLSEVEADLLRIAQEAMGNAVKHSGADHVRVELHVAAPAAELRVSDDGVGLGEVKHDSQGLRIMQERADRIGATLVVHDLPTGGASVLVQIGPDVRRIHATRGLVRT